MWEDEQEISDLRHLLSIDQNCTRLHRHELGESLVSSGASEGKTRLTRDREKSVDKRLAAACEPGGATREGRNDAHELQHGL